MFYHWAAGNISAHSTPYCYGVMKHLITIFSQFEVQQGLSDIKDLFWADEENEHA